MAWSAADVPDQNGRVAVVTGANSGLGLETAKVLAARGATVVLACRDPKRAAAAADIVGGQGGKAELLALDLASLDSVRAAAAELRERFQRIDLLVNNAGVMFPAYGRTADGFELQIGTNHLGHFAFTGLVLDRLLPVPGSRVVVVASLAHQFARGGVNFDDLQSERGYNRIGAYGRSKLANLLFAYELQRRLAAAEARTVAVAAHPGYSSTELTRHLPAWMQPANRVLVEPLFAQPAEQGALPSLRAATDPDALGGQYYGPSGFQQMRGAPKLVRSIPASHDTAAQQRLWTVSQELTGVAYPV
ncbi:oxidoreductase [Streptacidiphilus jiangxiensis]|uniref:NAD(P)-dependent dehydrogenase, short-chain alcohol dehydrogenase family n=1 Tax=Streptacidiphilus jiangxiensis TaxID=235985 RepID=A0A1H7XLH9_STRJI|nr:oxidoreductase [Streptacidiphilus jiangxiensis]SEM34640.1 NAD(P)-dependent dehydrogenase, short-chain alcohol dehydrogenase family [Streptacidiphilus jiangxiensis]